MESRIVVIDDDETMREMLCMCFRSAGWSAFGFPYDEAHLAVLEEIRPTLIVLDINLRKLGGSGEGGLGWGFLQALKMSDSTAKIPVFITTNLFQFSAEQRGYLASRHITVVAKPFDLNSFLMLITETLIAADQEHTLFSGDLRLPVLVVEDGRDLSDTITSILEMEGYLFTTAFNGQEALDAVSRSDHALILLDIAMPVMTGLEFLKAYELQHRPHTPVVLLSGESDIRANVLPTFVVDIIHKPFQLQHLVKTVAKYAQPYLRIVPPVQTL